MQHIPPEVPHTAPRLPAQPVRQQVHAVFSAEDRLSVLDAYTSEEPQHTPAPTPHAAVGMQAGALKCGQATLVHHVPLRTHFSP